MSNKTETSVFAPEIKNWEIEGLLRALEMVGSMEIADFDCNRAIIKNIEALKSPLEAYTKAFQGLKRAHISVDENFNFKTTEDGRFYKFKTTQDGETYNKSVEDLNSKVVTDLKLRPIKLSALKEVKPFEDKDKEGNVSKKNILTASLIASLGALLVDDLD